MFVVKIRKPVSRGMNQPWDITDEHGTHTFQLLPENLPPHVRKALQYEVRAYFNARLEGVKLVVGAQVRNHSW